MPIDRKYGRVTTERGDIADDEPVVVFRAQDALLPDLLAVYRQMCEAAGSPPRHLDGIDESAAIVKRWQASHATKTPESAPSS